MVPIREEWLKEQYEIFGRTSNAIANELGVSKKAVVSRLRAAGIKMRSPYDYFKKAIDETWLIDQYKTRSAVDIAKELKTSKRTVYKALARLGVARRVRQDNVLKMDIELIKQMYSRGKSVNNIAKYFNVCRKTISKRLVVAGISIKKRYPYPACPDCDMEELKRQYLDKLKTLGELSSKFKMSENSITVRLRKAGVAIRTPFEYKNHVSSLHRTCLIPLLERLKVNHVTSHVLPRLPEQHAVRSRRVAARTEGISRAKRRLLA